MGRPPQTGVLGGRIGSLKHFLRRRLGSAISGPSQRYLSDRPHLNVIERFWKLLQRRATYNRFLPLSPT